MSHPKRVLLINQYFYPDVAATSQLLGDLAESLGSKGWNVVALSGRGSYATIRKSKESVSAFPWPGVSIRRVWCTNFGRGSKVARLCDYLTFLVSAAMTIVVSPTPNVVVCLSTPPFVAILGLLTQIRGSRLVYKVEDLYPEVAVALTSISENSLLNRLLSRLSKFIVRRADSVVALDEAMAKRLRHLGGRTIETIPNWADGAAIRPDPQSGQTFRQLVGLTHQFIVLYSGNLGLAHRFDAVIEAARRCLAERPDVLFLFVGDGPRLNDVRKATNGMANVQFLGYQPREKLSDLYNVADLHLVTLRDEVSGLLFPSKYPAALAAGKPVLLVGGSGAPFAQEIREKELGWVCPHQASAIVSAIQNAREDPEKRKAIGRNARQVFEARYSKTIAMERWEYVLKSVLHISILEREKAIEVRSA